MRCFKLIRACKRDFTGELLLKRKPSLLAQKLVFNRGLRYRSIISFLSRPERKDIRRRHKRVTYFSKRLVLRRQFFSLYGFYRLKTFRKFLRKAVRRSTLFSAEGVLLQLETRLSVLVFRLGFVSSILAGISTVRQGLYFVNRAVVYDPDFIVKVGDVIEISYVYRYSIFRNLYVRRCSRLVPVLCPRYLEVNYKLMCAILYRQPFVYEIPGFSKKFTKNYLVEEFKALR